MRAWSADLAGRIDEHVITASCCGTTRWAIRITGKSSGGFGAMITPMLRPDLFGALATHAGDSLYEYSYLPDLGHFR